MGLQQHSTTEEFRQTPDLPGELEYEPLPGEKARLIWEARADDKRRIRGMRIASQPGNVGRKSLAIVGGQAAFTVKSQSNPRGWYSVKPPRTQDYNFDPKDATCTCPDHGRTGKPCKHIWAIWFYGQAMRKVSEWILLHHSVNPDHNTLYLRERLMDIWRKKYRDHPDSTKKLEIQTWIIALSQEFEKEIAAELDRRER
jgi:hypothetical protein